MKRVERQTYDRSILPLLWTEYLKVSVDHHKNRLDLPANVQQPLVAVGPRGAFRERDVCNERRLYLRARTRRTFVQAFHSVHKEINNLNLYFKE